MKKVIFIILGIILVIVLFFTFSYMRMLNSSKNKAKEQTRDIIEMQQAEYEREQNALDDMRVED